MYWYTYRYISAKERRIFSGRSGKTRSYVSKCSFGKTLKVLTDFENKASFILKAIHWEAESLIFWFMDWEHIVFIVFFLLGYEEVAMFTSPRGYLLPASLRCRWANRLYPDGITNFMFYHSKQITDNGTILLLWSLCVLPTRPVSRSGK